MHHANRLPKRALPGLGGELLDRRRAERAHLDPGGRRR